MDPSAPQCGNLRRTVGLSQTIAKVDPQGQGIVKALRLVLGNHLGHVCDYCVYISPISCHAPKRLSVFKVATKVEIPTEFSERLRPLVGRVIAHVHPGPGDRPGANSFLAVPDEVFV